MMVQANLEKRSFITFLISFQLKSLQDDCIIDMQSGQSFPKAVVSMNAYIG